jgi:hypothetical protein
MVHIDHFHVYANFGGFWRRLRLALGFLFTGNLDLPPGTQVKLCQEPPCGR